MITNKEDLKKLLKTTVLTVNFKKKDDSVRKMVCTLNEEYLPDVDQDNTESKRTKKESTDAIAVWDLEKQAWRSFRLDSIINYETNH